MCCVCMMLRRRSKPLRWRMRCWPRLRAPIRDTLAAKESRMLSVLLVVDLVALVLLVVLLLRRQTHAVDPKLGEQMIREAVPTETLDRHVQMQLDSIAQKLSAF